MLTRLSACRIDWAPKYAAACPPPNGFPLYGTLLIARNPIAPGANGRRNRAAASAWVRAGGFAWICEWLDMNLL